jgi:hypothetical protein
MKWMGWSYDDLLRAPAVLVVEVIPELIAEERRDAEGGK